MNFAPWILSYTGRPTKKTHGGRVLSGRPVDLGQLPEVAKPEEFRLVLNLTDYRVYQELQCLQGETPMRRTCLTVLFLEITFALVALSRNATGGDNLYSERLPFAPKQSDGKTLSTVTAPADWHKVDAGPFSLFAPQGWQFHQLQGVDSYVGEFVGDGITLRFDFGEYSSGYIKKAKKPTYVIARESIGGFVAKVASPRTPGHGVTGVYFPNLGHSYGLFLWGQDLTSEQQELAIKIFETIRFGGGVPRYVNPPPPPPKKPQ